MCHGAHCEGKEEEEELVCQRLGRSCREMAAWAKARGLRQAGIPARSILAALGSSQPAEQRRGRLSHAAFRGNPSAPGAASQRSCPVQPGAGFNSQPFPGGV